MRAGETGEVVPQDVILRDAGSNRAAVVEVVRAMTGLETSAAADLVARVPSALRVRIAPALAEALRSKLVAAGATVEVRAHATAPVAAAPRFFDVYLQDRGANKIDVVRALKQMMGLGLREAVDLVDDAPSLLKRRIAEDEAEALRHELVEAGAVVEVRVHDGSAPPERAATGEASVTWGATATPSGASATNVATAANTPIEGFGVVLNNFGVQKINVIKVIREATGLGLKEAKDLAETTDALVKQGMSEAEAWALAEKLTSVGATVEVRRPPQAAVPSNASGEAFGVKLKHCGPNKISVIKLVREVTGLGLKDAKDLSESTDVWIREDMLEAEARSLAQQLTGVGASVEVHGFGRPAAMPVIEPFGYAVDGFGVKLKSCGPNKISVIKAIREARADLGLKDAKDLAESTDVWVKQGMDEEEARALAKALKDVGATVEIHGAAWEETPARGPVDVVLVSCGPMKINIIKVIRDETGLGLKECKDLAETPGSVVREGLGSEDAEALREKLVAFGATVELREVEGARPGPAHVDVFLRSHGPNKILVIKEVRALTGLGLKEAKDLVEAAPRMVQEQVELSTAKRLQAVLVEAGADVELR
ncbi:ribosomal protein L7/L12 [Nannocystis sp. SCPEA4]|nr:ribosomal protein L7/L12 [Nannocystis sp. SCPEA4]MCY1056662.1 ribosomal protein L7/L12 [Nannocystis sp. SCPEA4]